jgi:GNAT superfamily N-acetyltransferase
MKRRLAHYQSFRIRKAVMADAPRLAALATELGYPSTPSAVRRRLRGILRRADHMVFVAEGAGKGVVGWAHTFVHALVETDTFAEIGGLVVDARQRGRGIGNLLMRRVEGWARMLGARTVALRSNIIRKEAHRFYKRLGYEIVKTQFAFRKDLS